MYNNFRNDVLIKLSAAYDTEDIQKIMMAIDSVAVNYVFGRQQTAVATYDDTIRHLCTTYLMVKKLEGLSELTIKNYGYALNGFFEHNSKNLNEISANDIRAYLYAYQVERGCSERSLDKTREYICRFFKWANTEGYIDNDPSDNVKAIKHEVKPRRAMTQDELEAIRESCETLREKAIVEFLYSTGCRVSELVGVTKDDINWEDKTVHLFGKGKKHRTSYLNAKSIRALEKYLAARTDDNPQLFVGEIAPFNAITTSTVEKVVKKLASKSGCTHVTPHTFRHTTATHGVQSGMPIQEMQKLLGHESINTTMIYAEILDNSVKESHNRYIV